MTAFGFAVATSGALMAATAGLVCAIAAFVPDLGGKSEPALGLAWSAAFFIFAYACAVAAGRLAAL